MDEDLKDRTKTPSEAAFTRAASVIRARRGAHGAGFEMLRAVQEIRRLWGRPKSYEAAQIAFGDHAPKSLSSCVYDLNDPQRMYDLCARIYAGKNARAHQIEFKEDQPVFLILPPGDQANKKTGECFFRACKAQGQKGERSVVPVLSGAGVFPGGDKTQRRIVAVNELTLRPTPGNPYGNMFELHFKAKAGHNFAFTPLENKTPAARALPEHAHI